MPQLHTIHFNSTKTCNLSCLFCYDNAVRERTDNLTLDTIYRFAKDAAELGCRRVILSGGEPMTRHDWQDVAVEFDQYGIEISLATNGTLINNEVVHFIRSLTKPTLSISLDGGEQVHNHLRGSKTAFQRTIAGLKKISISGIPFHVNAVVYRGNLTEIGTLTKLARDFNCPVRLTLLHNNGRASQMDGQTLTTEDIFRLRDYCHILRKAGVNIFLNLPPLLQYIDEIIPSRGAACGWAKNFCGVLANGDITICGVAGNEPQLIAGNILRDRFRDVWNNAQLFTQTRAYDVRQLKGICGKCPFNEFCGGACRLSAFRSAGDFFAPYGLCQDFYESGFIPETLLESTSI